LLCHYSLGTILHGLADQQEKAHIINEIQLLRNLFLRWEESFFAAGKTVGRRAAAACFQ
jgi:hypothetical protein